MSELSAGYANVRVRVHADLSAPVNSRLLSFARNGMCVRTCQSTSVTTAAVHVECTQLKHRLQRIKTVSDQYLAELGQTSSGSSDTDTVVASCSDTS